MKTTRLKVTLRDVEPRVLRVLDVPADSTLGELHELVQIGFGWLGLQPYQFLSGSLRGAREAVLPDLGEQFGYLYNPQARWEHDVVVLGPGGERVGCVYGEGPCPPENSSGPEDYADRRRHLDGLARELFWAPNPPEFDQGLADLRVRQMAGMVPESALLLLELVGEGVELSLGGELPGSVIQGLLDRRPGWPTVAPLAALQGVLRSTGVLVRSSGRLRPAPDAQDPQSVVRKLRSWFTPGSFSASVAGLGVGALAARGALDEETLVHIVLSETDREHGVDAGDVRQMLHRLLPTLTGLDLAVGTPAGWAAGPSARTLLPRATALSVYAPRRAGPALTARGR